MAVNIPWICKRVLENDVSHETEGSATITMSPRASSTHSNIDAGFGVKKGWVNCDVLWQEKQRIQRSPLQRQHHDSKKAYSDSRFKYHRFKDSRFKESRKDALGCPLTNALTFSLTNGLQYRGVVESHEKDESRRELEALRALCGMFAGLL